MESSRNPILFAGVKTPNYAERVIAQYEKKLVEIGEKYKLASEKIQAKKIKYSNLIEGYISIRDKSLQKLEKLLEKDKIKDTYEHSVNIVEISELIADSNVRVLDILSRLKELDVLSESLTNRKRELENEVYLAVYKTTGIKGTFKNGKFVQDSDPMQIESQQKHTTSVGIESPLTFSVFNQQQQRTSGTQQSQTLPGISSFNFDNPRKPN